MGRDGKTTKQMKQVRKGEKNSRWYRERIKRKGIALGPHGAVYDNLLL